MKSVIALRRFARTARTGARIALSDGQGKYLVALVALGAAALFLHRALTPEWRYRDALKRLVAAPHEPYRGETHPVLAAALLHGASDWRVCKDGDLLTMTDQVARDVSKLLSAASLRAAWANSTASTSTITVALALDEMLSMTDQVARDFLALRLEVKPDGTAARPSACTTVDCPTETQSLGHAWTDASETSTLMIPSTVAVVLDKMPNVEAVLAASARLEEYVHHLKQFPSGNTVRAIYFIDLLGSFRYVPRWEKNPLPAHRTFAGSSYVYSALSREHGQCDQSPASTNLHVIMDSALRNYHDVPEENPAMPRTATRPYLDLAGRGVVGTLCYPVGGNRVLGTLCFDVSPPDEILQDMLLNASDLFDLHVVWDRNGEFEPCNDCPDELSRLSLDELEYVAERRRPSQIESSTAGASAISFFEDRKGKVRYFSAVIANDDISRGGGGRKKIVIGRIPKAPGRDVGAAAVMMFFVVIASALGAFGLLKKVRRLDLAVTQGLQVGVVEVNSVDVIVAANDRAEEIFDQELPRFGASLPVKPRLFKNQIVPDLIVFLDDAGGLPSGPVRFSEYKEIDQQRLSGHSGSYYAFTVNRKQWIRVSGSTMVKPDHSNYTFGMLDTYVDEHHRRRLEAARAARGRSS